MSKPLLTKLTKIETKLNDITDWVDDLEKLKQRVDTLEHNNKRAITESNSTTTPALKKSTEEILDQMKRKNNAVIFGIPEQDEDTTKQKTEEIAGKLNITISIQRLTRIGKPKKMKSQDLLSLNCPENRKNGNS